VLDKLSGLYLTTSHAVKINSPVTFELVPIMLHDHIVQSSPSVDTSDVHYLWMFGDEVSRNLMSFDCFTDHVVVESILHWSAVCLICQLYFV